ncbi:MAG: hypothetical protein WD025_07070 [Bacteriovoracaceae bacterium]
MPKNKKRRKPKHANPTHSEQIRQAKLAERKYKPMIFWLMLALMIGGLIVYNISFTPTAAGL